MRILSVFSSSFQSSQKQAQCWKEESITQPLESKQSFAEKIQNRQTFLASVLTIFLISNPQTRDIGEPFYAMHPSQVQKEIVIWQDYLNQISLILAKILLKVTISLWTWDPLL